MKDIVKPFLDETGEIKQLPVKEAKKLAVLKYLAEKFQAGIDYKEKEVNAIIEAWHTFGDYFLLRRELVDHSLLCRTADGAKYWKTEDKSEQDRDDGRNL